jgi:nitric oxide reductase NorD protein
VSRLALAVLHDPFDSDSHGGPSGAAETPWPALLERYRHVAGSGGEYRRPRVLELLGQHDFSGAVEQLEVRRALVREAFVRQLGRLVADHRQQSSENNGGTADQVEATQIMLVEEGEQGQTTRRLVLHIDNENCQLPDELQALAAEILQDRGRIPAAYIAAAVGVAGGGVSSDHHDEADAAGPSPGPSPGARLVDEWDFRRNGYRKNWCAVYEKELPLVQSNFVAATLQNYHRVLLRLRRQFEMMRVDECFVGRQREGDELDLDAAVEARADRRASTAASDRLFVRLQRNERDLASLFLVDLSNSTRGWVGTVIKESLVMLCEAMAAAGDRYGIYGFSGMRRSRCELFPIKRLDEPYGEAVARRIGSIAPREYTRLGPAIRRGAELLGASDARTRLLVTLTDGKPEDYDDYKGEYAVEDTRKALLEARGSGLHAFGVTIDRQARDYLPRIFGSDHYLLIDQVQQLPLRMVDLYRHLTS